VAEQQAVPIDKEDVPYSFDISLADELFTLEVGYNARFDFYTLSIEKDGELLAGGEKVVYGRPMFSGLSDTRLPKVTITPSDVAGIETRAGYDEINETVFLFVGEAEA
jgi:hypothetical protein